MGAMLLSAASVQADEALRAEVGLPLRAAQDLMKVGKNKEALARIREAEAVANRSPYENFVIERLRGSAAAAVGALPSGRRQLVPRHPVPGLGAQRRLRAPARLRRSVRAPSGDDDAALSGAVSSGRCRWAMRRGPWPCGGRAR